MPNTREPGSGDPVHLGETVAAIIAKLPPHVRDRIRRDTERLLSDARIAGDRCRPRAKRDRRGQWTRRPTRMHEVRTTRT